MVRVPLQGVISTFAVLALGLSLGIQSSYAAVAPTPDCTLAGGSTCQVVFNETSSVYNWTVPSNVSSVHVVTIGGTGGWAGAGGGRFRGKANKTLQK